MENNILLKSNAHINNFERVKDVLDSFGKIGQAISKANDWGTMDDIERCLAVLMGKVKIKIEKHKGTKQSWNNSKLCKKLGLSDNGAVYKTEFLDHCSKIILDNGKEYFISEPYNIDLFGLKELIKFCEDNNVNCMIDGESSYNTGRTFRLMLNKKEGDKKE